MMRLTSAGPLVLVLGTLGCGESSTGGSLGEAGTGGSNGGTASGPGGGSMSDPGGGMSDPGGKSNGGSGGSSSQAGTSTGGGGSAQGGFPGVSLPEGKGWLELPDTELSKVCACNDGFEEVCANSGCGGIFAWSSGAYDSLRSRLIVSGGGHSDYFGNELYALSLSDRAMTRLTDPGLPLNPECAGSTANGTQASSRHTYDALLYLEHADRLFVFGGSMPPCGYLGDDTWTYSFADEKWEPHTPGGPTPKAVPGIVADYDPMSKKVFLHDDTALYSYTLEDDAFVQLVDGETIDYHMSAVLEPVARKLVLVGAGDVFTYDIDSATPTRSTLTTTGADDLVGSGYPGLAFDSDSGKIVGWNGGDSAYSLDLATGTWTALTSMNGPGDPNETGTYKRWRYVPGQGSFVLVNGPSQNAFLFRL